MLTKQRVAAALIISSALLVAACNSVQAVTVTVPTPTPISPGGPSLSMMTESNGRIWLEAPVGKYQSGWATFSKVDGGLKIEIDVTPPEPVPQPAHIHMGNCANMGEVAHKLESIVGGKSVTVISDIGIRDVATGELTVNLHRSFDDFPTFTACGDIPGIR